MANPPTPVEKRRRLGNPSGRPLPDIEETGTILPASNGHMPDPLRPLGIAGRMTWDHVLKAGAVWIGETDVPLLQKVCEQIDEQQALRMKVLENAPRREGWRDRKHLRDIDEQIRRALSELGLTPTARTRLGLAQVTAQAINANTERQTSHHRGKMFDDDGIVEAEIVLPEPAPAPTPPRKSWTKGKILAWYEENSIETKQNLTRRDLLAQAGVEL